MLRFHHVSSYSFAHGKISSGERQQKATYGTRAASLACQRRLARNVPRQVGSTYQALWTKARKNAEARRLGYTKRRFKGLDQAPDSRLSHPHLPSGARLLGSELASR